MAEQVSSLKTGIKYKDTPVGKIPVDWEVKRLEDTASNEKYSFTGGPFGSDLKEDSYTDDGVRVIQLQNIGDGKFLNEYKIFTSEEKAGQLKNCNIYPGDIIIAKMADPVARACIIPDEDKRYLMASDGIRLSINKEKYDVNFMLYAINSPNFRKNAESHSTGSTRLRIGLTELRNLLIAIPPLKDQKKIAEILTTVDEAIEKTAQVIETTKEVKKGLMQKLLTHGIGHKKFKETEIGEMPVEWKVGAFSEIADINPKRDLEKGVSYPFVEMAAIDSESHNVQFSKPRKYEGSGTKFQNGDTLFARITPCTENGKTAYVDFLKENNFGHGSTEFIVLGPPKNVDSKFIYYCAKWDKVRNIAVSKMEGTSGRQRVPSRVFSEDIFIPMPPLPEQKQITEILSSVDEEIERETSHKEQLGLLKKGLMQVLLTGKIRVVV